MSEVNASDLRLIGGPEDVFGLYPGAGGNARVGAEIELAFFDPASPGLAPMNIPQNLEVRNAANARCGENCVRNEPSSDMLEVDSIALSHDNLGRVMQNLNGKIRFLTDTAAQAGLKRSWFQDQPAATAADLFKNVVNVDRYQAFFAPPRADMMDIATYFFVSKSNQVSVSYRDPVHMFENIRRLYFLAPFLFMLTDNSSGFDQGKKFSGHAGMYHRASLKDRGLFPPYLFTAATGEDYLAAHIAHVMKNPLFVYYDRDGKIVKLPSGTWTSFNQLRGQGLNTATNYFFAQSILWPDVKIAALKNNAGTVTGHRYEARMFGVGLHQHQTALLIVSGLAFNAAFAIETDSLLRDFGFHGNNPDSLKESYDAARNHNGLFFDIRYGTGRMADFARKFADLLEAAYDGAGYDSELAPALAICRDGFPDARVNRVLFPTLEAVMEQQRTYDPALLNDPNNCAWLLYRDRLK